MQLPCSRRASAGCAAGVRGCGAGCRRAGPSSAGVVLLVASVSASFARLLHVRASGRAGSEVSALRLGVLNWRDGRAGLSPAAVQGGRSSWIPRRDTDAARRKFLLLFSIDPECAHAAAVESAGRARPAQGLYPPLADGDALHDTLEDSTLGLACRYGPSSEHVVGAHWVGLFASPAAVHSPLNRPHG